MKKALTELFLIALGVLGLTALAMAQTQQQTIIRIGDLPPPPSGGVFLSQGDIVPGNRTINGKAQTYQMRVGFGTVTCPASQWINAISGNNISNCTQPQASDISGLGTAATVAIGTSGATVPLNNGNNVFSGNVTIGTGSFTLSGLTGSVQCLHVSSAGLVTGSGSDCGSGGGSSVTLGTTTALANPQRSGQTNTGFWSPATQVVGAVANGVEVERWNTITSGVDYVSVTPGTSGTQPSITVGGSTATQGLSITSKSGGTLKLNTLTIGTTGIITSGTWNGTTIANTFLPIGSSAALGVLRGDASTITIGTTGIASCTTATTSQLGCVKPDGTSITISGGVITAVGGTVTSVATTSPITGGTITTTGTITCATCVTSAASLTSGKIIIGGGSQASAVDASAGLSAGALTLGASGTAGSVAMGNATSGTITLQPVTGTLGTVTVSIPAATDTLVNLTGIQTLTNKTLTSPTMTAPTLGAAFATTLGIGTTTLRGSAILDVYGPVTLGTAAADQFVLNSDGGVTIGTTQDLGPGTLNVGATLYEAGTAVGGGGGMVYPGAGIANSTGSAWATSYATSGSGTTIPLTAGPTFTGMVALGSATTSGNVGIGTTNPLATIDINGGAYCRITAAGTQSAGGTLTPNMATECAIEFTFGAGNLTVANPTTILAGATLTIFPIQDGTGSRIITWGTDYKWAGATAPTLSTAASDKDAISCFADTSATLICTLVGLNFH